MAANIQPYIKVDKFSGKLEAFDDFRSSIESAVAVSGDLFHSFKALLLQSKSAQVKHSDKKN